MLPKDAHTSFCERKSVVTVDVADDVAVDDPEVVAVDVAVVVGVLVEVDVDVEVDVLDDVDVTVTVVFVTVVVVEVAVAEVVEVVSAKLTGWMLSPLTTTVTALLRTAPCAFAASSGFFTRTVTTTLPHVAVVLIMSSVRRVPEETKLPAT